MRTSSPRLVVKPIALAVALALASPHAFAAPTGHTVVAGDIQVTQPNAQTMVINQRSDKAILNWRGFSIAAGETVQFVQRGSNSVALNRVTSGAPSEIFGRLSANGKVFLVNPSGVMFGKGASVDVGGLVASTLDIADEDFLAGRFAFANSSDQLGAVRNEGRLAAAERGTIALLGAQVSNGGTITARLGTVGLAAGGKVTLDFNGDGLTRIVVDAARINALVENGGAIISDGGLVTMSARAVEALADTVVRQQGVVQANALVERNGRIVLDGGGGGKVELAGKMDAIGLAAGQRGGEVTLLGRDIHLAAGAGIDVSGDAGGGSVLIGGDYQGANPLVPHAASTTMDAGAAIRADALGNGSGGKVVLWSDGHTSAHGSASAKGGAQGGGGGIVESSGLTLDVARMRVTAGAAKGAPGTWLLDPGDITIDAASAAAISGSLNNSTNVTVSTRNADAEGPGDIFVNASIEKTAGGDATLLLEASRDIIVAPGTRIASLGSAGKLNVDFNADWDNSLGGAVALMGAAVLTNGGDVRIYGQDDPLAGRARGSDGVTDGVLLQDATIDTRRGQSDAGAGGLIAIAGTGADYNDFGFSGGFGFSLTPAAPAADSVGVRIVDSSLLSSSANITISGTGGTWSPSAPFPVQANGVVIDLVGGARIATGSGALTISGIAGAAGIFDSATPGLLANIGAGSSISTTGGAIDFSGTGSHTGGAGIDMSISGGTVSGGGAVSMTGIGGVLLNLDNSALLAAGGALSLAGSGSPVASGVELSMDSSTVRAAQVAMSGEGGSGGAGVRGFLRGSTIAATNGPLSIDGTGDARGAGVDLAMSATSIGATGGDVMITGTGGDTRGSGVVISSLLEGGSDGSSGSGGIMTGSSARIYADRGNLTVAGINGSGAFDDTVAGRAVAGVALTGIELNASGGDVLIAGAAAPGVDIVPVGVSLTNVLASAAGSVTQAPGSVRILAGVAADTPALIMDGVTLGGAAMNGNIIIGARNAGGAPVFSYPGDSQWANSVRTQGVINLRPDDGNYDYGGIAASTLPISVGAGPGAAAFNVSFSDLGIGRTAAANVVIGSAGHTGLITFRDPTRFVGNLTLQNDGAGSAGILLASNLTASGQVTLSSGGAVSAPGSAIDSVGLLLHGSQPESNFVLDDQNHSVGWLAAWFDGPASSARPEYGDVSFRNSGPLVLSALSGKGFSTVANQATAIAVPNTVVAGDLLVRASGQLTLAQEASTLGGDITLVTDTVLDSGGHALAPSGTWRVFADTWVGENRSGLTPSLLHPNYYNCAYGAACAAVIAGNRFIYRAQPTLTLTADNLARAYGASNPALTFTQAGLVNGDTLADVLSGGYTTAALQMSGVGDYAIGGAFTSPVGYAVDVRPGTLTIDRAALLISVDDKSKVYGSADPLLTATSSGLAPFDTGSVVTGLTLTAPTGAAATAGSHAIVGANAAAGNYVISYRQGTLTVAKAPLLVAADNKSKVYGAPVPALTATMSGFQYGDTAAAVSGLTLSAPVGAAAGAGNHPIVAQGGVAGNYTLSYLPGVLAVDPAVLAYVANPAVQPQGRPAAIGGTVTGFAYDDNLASATSGTLEFVALAPSSAPPGRYAVEGRGLSAANYRFVQAPSNATALMTMPLPANDRPTIAKDITFESSNVYEKNFGTPRLCVGTGPLGSGSTGSENNDLLALEWSRVRVSPNLSNCLGLGQRNSCQDF